MPRGAFKEGIVKRTLLVAMEDQDLILGYLLFRVTHAMLSVRNWGN